MCPLSSSLLWSDLKNLDKRSYHCITGTFSTVSVAAYSNRNITLLNDESISTIWPGKFNAIMFSCAYLFKCTKCSKKYVFVNHMSRWSSIWWDTSGSYLYKPLRCVLSGDRLYCPRCCVKRLLPHIQYTPSEYFVSCAVCVCTINVIKAHILLCRIKHFYSIKSNFIFEFGFWASINFVCEI